MVVKKSKPKFRTKITPAASQVIRELERDFRQQLLETASKSAETPSGETLEISVKDVLNGFNRMGLSKHQSTNTNAIKVAKILVLLGLLTSLFSYIGETFFGFSFSSEVSRLMSLLSFALVLNGWVFWNYADSPAFSRLFESSRRRSPKSLSDEMQYGTVVKQWQEIEVKARVIVSEKLGESQADVPLSVLGENLKKLNIFGDKELLAYKSLLQFRNRIVHGRVRINPDAYERALIKANNLINILNKY